MPVQAELTLPAVIWAQAWSSSIHGSQPGGI